MCIRDRAITKDPAALCTFSLFCGTFRRQSSIAVWLLCIACPAPEGPELLVCELPDKVPPSAVVLPSRVTQAIAEERASEPHRRYECLGTRRTPCRQTVPCEAMLQQQHKQARTWSGASLQSKSAPLCCHSGSSMHASASCAPSCPRSSARWRNLPLHSAWNVCMCCARPTLSHLQASQRVHEHVCQQP